MGGTWGHARDADSISDGTAARAGRGKKVILFERRSRTLVAEAWLVSKALCAPYVVVSIDEREVDGTRDDRAPGAARVAERHAGTHDFLFASN
jgi:hypothetical protein